MKMLTFVLLFVIACLVAWIYLNRPAPPIPEPAYQETIDSLRNQIWVIEVTLELEREKRDSLEKAGIRIITVRDTVLRDLATLPPDETVRYFDSITPGSTPTIITEKGVLTDITRITEANVRITENGYLKDQIRNDALIIESLDAQVENEQEARELEHRKYNACEESRGQLAGENERLKKRVKWANGVAGATTILALISIIM